MYRYKHKLPKCKLIEIFFGYITKKKCFVRKIHIDVYININDFLPSHSYSDCIPTLVAISRILFIFTYINSDNLFKIKSYNSAELFLIINKMAEPF